MHLFLNPAQRGAFLIVKYLIVFIAIKHDSLVKTEANVHEHMQTFFPRIIQKILAAFGEQLTNWLVVCLDDAALKER